MLMIPEIAERLPRTDDNYIRTYTGRRFWPLDPRPNEVCIEDIAHALSQLCRFTGHTRVPYSVAQHSVLVSHHVEDELDENGSHPTVVRESALWGLLHDASEAYLQDLPSPIKCSPYLGPIYRGYESLVMGAIIQKFDLMPHEPRGVKIADKLMLAAEKRDLMCGMDHADTGAVVAPGRIEPMGFEAAECSFLLRFAVLMQRRLGKMAITLPSSADLDEAVRRNEEESAARAATRQQLAESAEG